MATQIGMVKTTWEEVRASVVKVEPSFAKIVDRIAPDKSFPLYKGYYPFGAPESDPISSLFPDQHGGFYRLTDLAAPKDISQNLLYSGGTPFSMVLEKQLELFIDLKDERITIPWMIYHPGMFFPLSTILSLKNTRRYAPNGLLSSVAGARSVFLLPNVGCNMNHSILQRDLNIRTPAPKSLYDHWYTFRDIAATDDAWKCCILYFSKKWIQKIYSDPAWLELKQYLYELSWKQYEYERNRVYYDMTFSMIQKKRNLKPNPYLADTARHLFATALGAAPGFAPATDESALPLKLIQTAYVESYHLKKYLPTVIKAEHYHFEKSTYPIYYSLQNPSTHIFSPKSREVTNTLYELRELENIMRIFSEELSQENAPCADTILGNIAAKIKFKFYHCKQDRYGIVQMSEDIVKTDKRFAKVDKTFKNPNARFSADAPFLRGCVSIYKN